MTKGNNMTATTMAKATKTKTTAGLRKQYRNALRGLTYDNASVAEVTAAVKRLAGTDPTPEAYVKAIEAVRMPCRRCAGTGQFITMVINGSPTGPGGECFRCNGKREQSHNDGHRNRVHDEHYVPRGM